MFIVLEIKTKKFQTHLNHLKVAIKSIHVNTKNIFMKNNNISPQKSMRRWALFYIFANLFNDWFNRRQLDSHFTLHSALVCHIHSVFPKVPDGFCLLPVTSQSLSTPMASFISWRAWGSLHGHWSRCWRLTLNIPSQGRRKFLWQEVWESETGNAG